MNNPLTPVLTQTRQTVDNLWASHIAPRLDALSESERRTVTIAAIALPLIFFVFGIILPVLDKHAALQRDIARLSQQVAEADRLADQLAANPKSTRSQAKTGMLSDVDKLARTAGVRSYMTRLRPQQAINGSQRLQTQIKNAPYTKAVVFLAELEKQGYRVTSLNMQKAGQGLVHIQAIIER